MSELIRLRESKRYPGLFVRKYNNRVFFRNLWDSDETLLESRGHVFDRNGDRVINPFTKVFNYGENGTTIGRDVPVLAVEKINGFMAAATYVDLYSDVIISTTGSLDSPFVDMAREMISPRMIEYIRSRAKVRMNMTYLFEIVHRDDPHIIPQEYGAYLIGARYVDDDQPYRSHFDMESRLDLIAENYDCHRPKWHCYDSFGDLLYQYQGETHEGYNVYSADTSLKLKTPYYLGAKAVARSKDIEKLSRRWVPEEFYTLIEHLRTIETWFYSMNETERLEYIRNFFKIKVDVNNINQ